MAPILEEFKNMNEKVIEEVYLSHSISGEWRRDDLTLPIAEDVEIMRKKSLPELIPAFGILMSVLSVICFSTVSVIVKVLTEIHSIELLAIRCGFQFVFFMAVTLLYKHPFFGQSGNRFNIALRGIFGSISATCIYMAFRLIPLADASTLHFSSPVFVIILAYFILKERITLLHVITGTVTLTGVVFVAKPEFIFNPNSDVVTNGRLEGILLAITAAFTTALVLITLRKLKTTPVSVVIMWYSFINVISSLVFLAVLDKFVWPSGGKTWALLLAVGVFGICDQFFMTLAMHYESAGPVSVARTLNIVLAFAWDVLLLSASYDWTSILGACFVSVSIVILGLNKWREEKPELFEDLKSKLFCCRKNDENSLLRKQSMPYYDSYDSRFASNANNKSNGRLLLEDNKI